MSLGIFEHLHFFHSFFLAQGRNPKYDNLPVSRALSMGVHESQSLLWERMVFQSREFWVYATPLVRIQLDAKTMHCCDAYTFHVLILSTVTAPHHAT
jgi:carboxypeptidase Taq